jgi:hypothetical protein
MEKFPIVEEFKRTVRGIFVGMAHPILVEIPDDRVIEDVDYVYGVSDQKRYLVSEKVQKFNRKAMRRLKKVKIEKADPRVVGTQDTMIIPVGKPGTRERVEALRSQYEAIAASGEEVSPFAWKDE